MADCIPRKRVDDITEICLMSNSLSIFELADELLMLDSIRMHGPEHHYLVSAVLVTIYCNGTKQEALKQQMLEKALFRANRIQPGSCGYYGVCGAALAVGSAISIIQNVTPYSPKGLKTLGQITLKCQTKMSCYIGPRCCKRATYVVLEDVHSWFEQQFQLDGKTTNNDASKFACGFSNCNNTCLKVACKYYNV